MACVTLPIPGVSMSSDDSSEMRRREDDPDSTSTAQKRPPRKKKRRKESDAAASNTERGRFRKPRDSMLAVRAVDVEQEFALPGGETLSIQPTGSRIRRGGAWGAALTVRSVSSAPRSLRRSLRTRTVHQCWCRRRPQSSCREESRSGLLSWYWSRHG